MPINYVKDLAKKTGKSERELEKFWNEAKKLTQEEFGKKENEFKDKEWAYCTAILKKMAGLKEANSLVINFLKSDMPAKQFFETMASADLGLSGRDINMSSEVEQEIESPLETSLEQLSGTDENEKDEVIMIEKLVEEADIDKIIKDLVDKDLSSTNENQMAALELMKGLAISNDPKSNAFMKKLDKAITEIGKET